MNHHKYYPFCFLLLVTLMIKTLSAEPIYISPEYEGRYYSLLNELRCLVCQNQTIAESDAELAKDLRIEVKKMLEQGATDYEVIEFMANRYGDFVLYKPLVKPKTYFLWFGPFFFLGFVMLILVLVIKKQKGIKNPKLTDEELERLDSILGKTKD